MCTRRTVSGSVASASGQPQNTPPILASRHGIPLYLLMSVFLAGGVYQTRLRTRLWITGPPNLSPLLLFSPPRRGDDWNPLIPSGLLPNHSSSRTVLTAHPDEC
jgi:hypothetical protein